MRTLMLMRHASALDAHADHERPLSERGQQEAAVMGRWLAAHESPPRLVLASDAERATGTAQLVVRTLPGSPELEADAGLYLASPQSLLDRLCQVDDDCRAVLLVAHNPGVAELAAWLRGGGDSQQIERSGSGFVPGALACFRIDRPSWRSLVAGDGYLTDFASPSLVT